MTEYKTKHNFIKLVAALVLSLLLIVFLWFTSLTRHTTELKLLDFTIEKAYELENTIHLYISPVMDLPKNESLLIYAEHARIALCWNGQSSVYNELEITPRIFRSPGNRWFCYLSPGIRAGERIEIKITSYYKENAQAAKQLLQHFYIGDMGGLYQHTTEKFDFFIAVLLFSVASGLLYMIEGAVDIILGMEKDGLRIGLSGAFCFTGSLWSLTKLFYPYFTLFITPVWAATAANMVGLVLFPIAFSALIRFFMRGLWAKRSMNAAILFEAGIAFFCLITQLSGHGTLSKMQTAAGMGLLVSVTVASVCILSDFRRYRSRYFLLLLFMVLSVFVCVLFDVVQADLPFASEGITIYDGFCISMVLLLLQIVSYAKEELAKAQKYQEMEQELADSRISIMLSQVQPHFIYNALTGIKRLCDTNPKQASEALVHFSYYLRRNLDALVDMRLISFEKEMEHVKDYLFLQKMRFPQIVNVKMELDYMNFEIPPLTIQPIVENAIQHGFSKLKTGGKIIIRSNKLKDSVVIVVKDNGMGFDVDGPQKDGRSHVGIKNIQNRLKASCNGQLLLESKAGAGTTIKIILPLNADK